MIEINGVVRIEIGGIDKEYIFNAMSIDTAIGQLGRIERVIKREIIQNENTGGN